FQSSVEPILHFGLGNVAQVDEITVTWPDGKEQHVKSTAANQLLELSYTDAAPADEKGQTPAQTLFSDITPQVKLQHFSNENEFDDFNRESLLPHKMSEEGPAIAIGDVDQNGLEDIYITGAKGVAGKLFLQQKESIFQLAKQAAFQRKKASEEVDATFFDADADGDLDLFVVTGGNEAEAGAAVYQDYLYRNNDGVFRLVPAALTDISPESGSVVRPHDFDQDGDLDLFIGSRQIPGRYPFAGQSRLLRNESADGQIRFSPVEAIVLDELGMVTDAVWADLDQDGHAELVVVGEWMPVQVLDVKRNGTISSRDAGLAHTTGWWFELEAGDFDHDGDLDFIAGNLGLNAKYQASAEQPFEIFADDFDQTGTLDIVLGYHQDGKRFPLRGRECSSNQMPFLKQKFPTYHAFASAGLEEVYGEEQLEKALGYRAEMFETVYLENTGDGQLQIKVLPRLAQSSCTRSVVVKDVNSDGHLDAVLFGNMYGFEVETPRQDASYGVTLLGNGKGAFQALMPFESGLYVKGQVTDADLIRLGSGKQACLIAKNKAPVQALAVD
ncbi:MAG: FG-GAP-like repeat-containing protein, partial [Bacteroidota bacterium]